jgi:hypothetical protein
MPSDGVLHERSDFKALVEAVAASEKINYPAALVPRQRIAPRSM